MSVAQIVDPEPALADYTSAEDLAHDVRVSTVGHAETIRDAITELLSWMDTGVLSTDCIVEGGPGQTSEYENWWCKDPVAASRALRGHLARVVAQVTAASEGTA